MTASRLAGGCAIAGSVLLLVGTYLHPMDADPNDAVAAFTEYAADRLWVGSHLTQLVGILLMVVAVVVTSAMLRAPRAASWARVAAAGGAAAAAVTAALQAVDGVALKRVVDAWAAAAPDAKPATFAAAFAVRQIEVGLASVAGLVLGVTVAAFGAALLADRTYPRSAAAVAIAGGAATVVAGVVMAYTGFSDLAMTIDMPSGLVLIVWMFAFGVLLWRRVDARAE